MREALQRSFQERGYVEGKNVTIDWRNAKASDDELPVLAAELVRSNVEVIITAGTPAARAALKATTTIPVVFSAGDPTGTQLAATLVNPGKNGTGVSVVSTELAAKRFDFLHQLVPGSRRIAYLINSSNPLAVLQGQEVRKAASLLSQEVIVLDTRTSAELNERLHSLQRASVDAVVVSADVFLVFNKARIAGAVNKARLPGMFPYREYVDEGALASYGPDLKEVARKMVLYVDKILKGAKPSDLPIEQISKYELVINLRTARDLKIHVSEELLLRADEVIR
jgi:putative ABC transport system substrate-binding protein